MDGPFTCEQLRNFRKFAIDHQYDRWICSVVDNIKNAILEKAFNSTTQDIDVSQNTLLPTQYKQEISKLEPVNGQVIDLWHLVIDKKTTLDLVMTNLKVMFPDMKITIDPQNTYILLDWS